MARPALRVMRNGPHLVYTEHNSWDCYGAATRYSNACTFPLDDAQFAVSNAARESVPAPLRKRVEVLTHGIDTGPLRSSVRDRIETRKSLGIGEDEFVITNLAHLRAEKAQDDLLHAAAQLVDSHPEVVLLSVGHGPRDEELERLHQRLGLGDRFRFLGFRDDAADILAASDVFCLSSRQEGLPVAFMEASALGVPTVSTRVGGIPDHIEDRESGLLVTPGDVEGLSDALARIADDAELRSRLGSAALGHSQVFDARLAVRRQEQVYVELCNAASRASLAAGTD